jgi:hypothetical protein
VEDFPALHQFVVMLLKNNFNQGSKKNPPPYKMNEIGIQNCKRLMKLNCQ